MEVSVAGTQVVREAWGRQEFLFGPHSPGVRTAIPDSSSGPGNLLDAGRRVSLSFKAFL